MGLISKIKQERLLNQLASKASNTGCFYKHRIFREIIFNSITCGAWFVMRKFISYTTHSSNSNDFHKAKNLLKTIVHAAPGNEQNSQLQEYLNKCSYDSNDNTIHITKEISASEFDKLKIPQAMWENVKFDKVILDKTSVEYLHLIQNGQCKIPEYVTVIDSDTFKDNEKLESVIIPEGVKTIGNSAFSGCKKLATIELPNKLETIGDEAFYNCESLTKITVPNSVQTIGHAAFWNCEKLANIQLPNDLETIGHYTFYGCESLTEITIPDSVTTIGNSVFYGCESLTEITIPDSVTTIGNSVFSGCESLTEITIPDAVKTIGSSAFKDCKQLKTITLPNKLEEIGDYTFHGCKSLTKITIPNTVKTIGQEAFQSCEVLDNIQLPNDLETIGNNAFQDCSNLETIIFDGAPPGYDYDIFTHDKHSNDTCLNNATIIFTGQYSDQEIEYIFEKLAKSLIHNCKLQFPDMEQNTIHNFVPNTARTVGVELAIINGYITNKQQADILQKLSKNENLKKFLDNPSNFKYENSIVHITKEISASEFAALDIPKDMWENVKFDNVKLSDTDIDALNLIDSQGKCTIPEYVTEIAISAFWNKVDIKSITIPESVTTIDMHAFRGCQNLQTVKLPNSLKTIGMYAFQDCTNLTTINLPQNLQDIQCFAFKNCTALQSIIIPKNVSLQYGAFQNCIKLQNITFNSIPNENDYSIFRDETIDGLHPDTYLNAATITVNGQYNKDEIKPIFEKFDKSLQEHNCKLRFSPDIHDTVQTNIESEQLPFKINIQDQYIICEKPKE